MHRNALAHHRWRKAVNRNAGLIGVEGKGRVGEPHASAHRPCGGALVALFLRDQSLPVGDGDLVVVRMNFRKRQEAVTVAAVIDEGRLQRRLNACDFG